jgi:hypothetical protein
MSKWTRQTHRCLSMIYTLTVDYCFALPAE